MMTMEWTWLSACGLVDRAELAELAGLLDELDEELEPDELGELDEPHPAARRSGIARSAPSGVRMGGPF
jgi:hypothetical protein